MLQSCCSTHGRADFTVFEKRQGERLVSWIVNVTGSVAGEGRGIVSCKIGIHRGRETIQSLSQELVGLAI